MTFDSAYNYLLSLSNFPRQEYMNDHEHCAVYLERIQFLLDILGNPEQVIPHYIHVTGTSGKGSVCLLLQSILSTSGKKTGVLISPHPTRITERWQIDGKEMSEAIFVLLIEQLKPALETYTQTAPYDMLSFHELTTVLGLLYFAKEAVDWAILEVGCGGRYDSTNIIPYKDVAVITNIGLDHTQIIGDTKEKIAYEKAGIIHTPCNVFTMEKKAAIQNIIETECATHQAPFHYVIADDTYIIEKSTLTGTTFSYHQVTYQLHTLGAHQIHNAILAIEIARSLTIDHDAIVTGINNAILPIRMEVVSSQPTIILDSAHNEDKITSTVNTILHLSPASAVHLVLGFSENKDIRPMLHSLQQLHPQTITCTRNTSNHFRKVLHPKQLADMCMNIFPEATTIPFLDPQQAIMHAKAQCKKHDILLVTGSVFLAGELRGELTNFFD